MCDHRSKENLTESAPSLQPGWLRCKLAPILMNGGGLPLIIILRTLSSNALMSRSVLQTGPEFFTLPVSEWLISQAHEDNLPDRVGVTMTTNAQVPTFDLGIGIERFSSYNKLVSVTCRLLMAFRDKSLRGIFKTPSVDMMKKAENL